MAGKLEQKGGKIQATKHDGAKPRFALLPRRALAEVAAVFTYGAAKYDIGNWHRGDGFDWDRLQSASLRHDNAFALGEDLDPESLYHHLAHKICCDMMLLEHCLTNHGKDNRHLSQFIRSRREENNGAQSSAEGVLRGGDADGQSRRRGNAPRTRRPRLANGRKKFR